MRTNIEIDEALVAEARRYSPARTKKALVHQALREFVESHARRDLRELRGRVAFRAGYDHKSLRRENA